MSTYKDRIAAGLCGKCGNERDDAGSLCKTCRKQAKQRAAEKRARNSATGTCLNCGKPSKGGTRCKRCKKITKASRDRAVVRRKESGQCVACGKPAKEGRTLCQKHIDDRSKVSSERYARNREAGLCGYCGAETEGDYHLCIHCRGVQADLRAKEREAAFAAYGGPVCVGCGSKDEPILEMDHIDGGGCQHKREIKNLSIYRWLKQNNYPPGFRVLCPTCNKKAHLGLLTPA